MTKAATADDDGLAEAHAAVFRAAGELFARQGYGMVTIRAIAARAGTSPALVMKVGGSKRELFHRTATLAPPDLPNAPASRLGHVLVEELIDRHRRGDLEHLGRAIVLKFNAPDPDAVRVQFLSGYIEPLAAVLEGPEPRLRAELAAAALVGLAATLRFFEPPGMNAELDAVALRYGRVVQSLLDEIA